MRKTLSRGQRAIQRARQRGLPKPLAGNYDALRGKNLGLEKFLRLRTMPGKCTLRV